MDHSVCAGGRENADFHFNMNNTKQKMLKIVNIEKKHLVLQCITFSVKGRKKSITSTSGDLTSYKADGRVSIYNNVLQSKETKKINSKDFISIFKVHLNLLFIYYINLYL